ncbi:DUF732 domain-containing protein [Mycobacterium lacus]|nr:DUF732 domain-containing protein [Mycobacterium lacus]
MIAGASCSERTATHVRSPSPARFGAVRSLWAELAVSVALMCLAAVAAPTARADAVDDNFLTALKARGINFASARAAIMAGHAVCDELDGGRQLSDVASDVMKNSNLDGYHAGFFVGASIGAFCPRHNV